MALTSFFTALTGLNSNSHTINVIGDNLANMNTIGFKAGKATFAEIIGGMSGFSATGNPIVFGQGSMLNGVVHKQAQGTPEYTGNSTDAMINGNGYFVVETGNGGIGYTRAGRFQFNSEGTLVSSDGYKLMGYKANEAGEIEQALGITSLDIRMGQFVPATGTSSVRAAVNLDSQVPSLNGDSLAVPPIPPSNDPKSVFVTPIEIFDPLGAQQVIQLRFEKVSIPGEAEPEWSMSAFILVPDPVNPGADPTPVALTINNGTVSGADFTLNFDKQGKLDTATMPLKLILTVPAGVPVADGTMDLAKIELLLFDPKNGSSMFTSAASNSATSATYQNGYASSSLKSVSFNNEGVIIGQAANGNSIQLGQLAIATFPNIEGLQKYNGSTLLASMNAGEPSIGAANAGGRGSINGGSLEMSNVDMAEEFVNLIIAQRAFQANARMITTSDELYMEAINLKR